MIYNLYPETHLVAASKQTLGISEEFAYELVRLAIRDLAKQFITPRSPRVSKTADPAIEYLQRIQMALNGDNTNEVLKLIYELCEAKSDGKSVQPIIDLQILSMVKQLRYEVCEL